MKKIFKLRINSSVVLLTLILLSSCTKKKEPIKTESKLNSVCVEYSNLINGYKVTAIWKPVSVVRSMVVGPAIIEFRNPKDSIVFNVTIDCFAIDAKKVHFSCDKDSVNVTKFNQQNITLLYEEKNHESDENFGNTNEAFFFQDVDFDNVKELIMREFANGQRWCSTFKVHKLNKDGQCENALSDITFDEPFILLDQMSKIDYVNKRIEIYSSGGSCSNETKVYRIDDEATASYGKTKMMVEFIKVDKYNSDEGKCYEETYRIIDGSKVFESQKENI